MKPPKLIAFWNHDSFPYFLSGEVDEIKPNGNVVIKSFGAGALFNPIRVVAWSEKLQENLDDISQMRNEYSRAQEELRLNMAKATLEILPFGLDIKRGKQ